MAFTITFVGSGTVPARSDLETWLTEQGEPFEADTPTTLQLRALPMRLVAAPDQSLMAQFDVTETAPLTRMVDVLFEISVRAGADVRVAGAGEISRQALWIRLADEQDRLRIAAALLRANEHGNREDVVQRLWAVVAALRPDRDWRWDVQRERVVELRDVGGPDGIPVEEARWHRDDLRTGDVVAVPVEGFVHTLVWRWLSEAYPGIAEAEHTGR